jgi:hypothetical protein
MHPAYHADADAVRRGCRVSGRTVRSFPSTGSAELEPRPSTHAASSGSSSSPPGGSSSSPPGGSSSSLVRRSPSTTARERRQTMPHIITLNIASLPLYQDGFAVGRDTGLRLALDQPDSRTNLTGPTATNQESGSSTACRAYADGRLLAGMRVIANRFLGHVGGPSLPGPRVRRGARRA